VIIAGNHAVMADARDFIKDYSERLPDNRNATKGIVGPYSIVYSGNSTENQ
jgi:hypothetical protein